MKLRTILNTILFPNELKSSTFTTKEINLLDIESFSIFYIWKNGSGFSANISLEASIDGVNFVLAEDSTLNINTNNGKHLWEVLQFSYNYVRVKTEILTGNSEIEIKYSLKSRG